MSMRQGSNTSFFWVLLLLALVLVFGVYVGKAMSDKKVKCTAPSPYVSLEKPSIPFMF